MNRNTSLAADSSVPGDAHRSAAESGLGDLVRLRFSRVEADEIARLAADKRNLKALDFSANRAVATDAKLGDYRIVHFATHSLINNQHPDLSGIVLSLVNEQGKPQTVNVITLLVTPQEAEKLTLASNEGDLQLALRNSLDLDAVPTPGSVLSNLINQERRTAPGPKVERPVNHPTRVEVIRGSSRSTETF